jgi:hypothetical protein
MGQFSKYIERAQPPRIIGQIVAGVVTVALVVAAVQQPGVETIARAIVILFIASGSFIPSVRDGSLDAWTEAHPPLNYLLVFLIVGGSLFCLLDFLLPSPTSALIAAPVALVLVAVGRILRRKST